MCAPGQRRQQPHGPDRDVTMFGNVVAVGPLLDIASHSRGPISITFCFTQNTAPTLNVIMINITKIVSNNNAVKPSGRPS